MTHEFSIVESLVDNMLHQLDEADVRRVAQVRFRRGSAFSEDALRQAFSVFSQNTPLEDAKLTIETVNLTHDCECGHHQIITSDDLIGHMFVCPVCGILREVDEAHDLELLEVVVAENA